MNNVILGNSLTDWLLAAGLIFLGVLIGRLVAGLYEALHKRVFVPCAGRSGGTIDLHLTSALNSIGFEVTAVLAGIRLALLPVKVEMKASSAMLQLA